MTIEVAGYQHGIFPRSEAVVAATRDLERGRTTEGAVGEAFASDRAGFVALQQEARLDLFSDGLLRWQDLFRPLVDAADGLTAGGLVRWFDNNAFYRLPEVGAPPVLRAEPPEFADLTDVPTPRVATLPSPYLFSQAAHGLSIVEAAESILRPAADALAARGCALIHLEEPWIGFRGIDDADWDPFEKAIGALTDGLAAHVVLHVFYGDVAFAVDRLRRFPVSAVGVDLVETDVTDLGRRWEVGLLAGCLNGRATVPEAVGPTADLVARAVEQTTPARLFVSSATELELLGRGPASEKVRRLGAITAAVKERLA